MRIVSICRSAGAGGMENVVRDRAEALREAGHEVFMVNARDGRYSDEFATICTERCDELAPDVIHLDSYDGARPWWVDRKERVALTLHSNPWTEFFTKWNLWRHKHAQHPGMSYTDAAAQCDLIRQADVVIAISRHEQNTLRDMCSVPDARLVYNPIAPCFFASPVTPPPADGYFLHVGRNPLRGWHIAAEAAEQVGVELRIAEGATRENMVAGYDGCRALVLPTFRAAGYDLTVAEAQARGRPVFASATGSYLSESGDGIVPVPLGDAKALADALMAPLPKVDIIRADRHRPERHAEAWLEAVA